MFLRLLKHNLPRAKAWRITFAKQLREYFEGLAPLGDSVKLFVDQVWQDIFPQTTRELDAWEEQWGLTAGSLTTQERRDRLDATWAATGGQSPKYIQDTIQAAGFTNVYIHEWFDPVGLPAVNVKSCVTPRDPTALGGLELLVNKIAIVTPAYLSGAGEALMEAGEATALAGNYTDLIFTQMPYDIPADTTKWPYFLYFMDSTYGVAADVPADRQVEFETLILKLKPAQQWAGLLINYV